MRASPCPVLIPKYQYVVKTGAQVGICADFGLMQSI